MKYFKVPQRIIEQNCVTLNVVGIYVDPEV